MLHDAVVFCLGFQTTDFLQHKKGTRSGLLPVCRLFLLQTSLFATTRHWIHESKRSKGVLERFYVEADVNNFTLIAAFSPARFQPEVCHGESSSATDWHLFAGALGWTWFSSQGSGTWPTQQDYSRATSLGTNRRVASWQIGPAMACRRDKQFD